MSLEEMSLREAAAKSLDRYEKNLKLSTGYDWTTGRKYRKNVKVSIRYDRTRSRKYRKNLKLSRPTGYDWTTGRKYRKNVKRSKSYDWTRGRSDSTRSGDLFVIEEESLSTIPRPGKV